MVIKIKMKCPICDYSSPDGFFKSFLPKTYCCSRCGIQFILEPKVAVYKKSYYRDTNSQTSISSLAHPILKILSDIKMRQIFFIVKSVKKPRILDYGSGAGEIVKNLKMKGINVVGFEPSSGANNITRNARLPVTNNFKKIKGKFDLIMMWHSLEHIEKPVVALKEIKKMLKPHGRLLLAVPNVDSLEARFSRGKWFHYTYPEHRFYYSPRSLAFLLKTSALKITDIDYLNFEYTSTGLAQTMLNMIFPKDVLYSIVSKRRRTMKKSKAILISFLSICVLLVLSPVLILVFIMQLFFRKTGAIVVTAK